MYHRKNEGTSSQVLYKDEVILSILIPDLALEQLQRSFDFVPYDNYFTEGSRYRTTSRVKITSSGYELLDRVPLYQPTYVNKLESYGGIDRIYDDVPESLLASEAFDTMIKCWLKEIPYNVETFSVHQIRTTDNGDPTPEGPHKDGTDWTGVFVVRRYNITPDSGQTKYWENDNAIIAELVPEGGLITHCDKYFTHCATPIKKLKPKEPSFRDVFVLTTPEHGVNHDQEEYREKVLYAET